MRLRRFALGFIIGFLLVALYATSPSREQCDARPLICVEK